jgi:deazaflavin-dependent oxidoreductase (nitroreductase family)
MNIREAVRNRVRIFNKHILNRLTRNLAGISRGPFAIVRHVGRRSDKSYETPIFVFRVEDGFVVVLTYGPAVDWYRNVLAAGHCELVWHAKDYTIVSITPMDIKEALPILPQPEKTILRILGTQHFVKMKSSS